MSHETDQLISKDQVSNQLSFNVWRVAVLNVCILSIWHRPICALFMFEAQPFTPLLCVCVCSSAKVSRSSFLVTCKQQRVLSVPPWSTHTHSTLHCARHQQEGERKQRAHFLYVQPAFCTMEQEVPGNCKRGHGVWRKDKVVSPSYKLLFSSPARPLSSVIFHYPICQGSTCVCLFSLTSFSKRIKTVCTEDNFNALAYCNIIFCDTVILLANKQPCPE